MFSGTRLWKAHLRFRLLLLHHFDPSAHSGSDVSLPWTLVPCFLPSHGAGKRRDGIRHTKVIAGMNCLVRPTVTRSELDNSISKFHVVTKDLFFRPSFSKTVWTSLASVAAPSCYISKYKVPTLSNPGEAFHRQVQKNLDLREKSVSPNLSLK